MKRLKCSSCGGHLKVEENNEYAVCEYCGSRYKLNEDLNISLKIDDSVKDVLNGKNESIDGFSKTASVVISIFAIGIIAIIVSIMVFNYSGSSFDHSSSKVEENVSHFNFPFLHDNGTKSSIFVEMTMDEIIQSNKTNDRKIVLEFNGNETIDEKEIIEIKHSLSGQYEVSINYDDIGYINRIIVESLD